MTALLDIVKKGSTDRSVTIRIIDSGDGTPETGVVYNSAGIDLWYRREGATKTSITEADLATPALDDAHLDGGFLHIGDGEYRLDLPDAAFATGANHVDVGGTVTGMVVIGGRVRLVDYDPEDTVRLGLTAMPNAAAGGAGGIPLSTAGSLEMDTLADWLNGGRLDLLIDAIKAKTDNLPADPADASDIAAAFAALNDPSAATIASTILAAGDVDGYSLENVLKLIAAAVLGKASGLATTTAVFRAADDSKDRITATVDQYGNRSAVVLDET